MFYVYIQIISEKGRRPLTYRMTAPSIEHYTENVKAYHNRGLLHICANRHLTMRDLQLYGYTTIKSRIEEIKE